MSVLYAAVDTTLWVHTFRDTKKARNLAANPEAAASRSGACRWDRPWPSSSRRPPSWSTTTTPPWSRWSSRAG